MNTNEKVYRNVKALAKLGNMDMKDVEAKIGRTPGYLSRKSSKIGVDELVTLSELFGVTTDEMLNGCFEYDLKRKEAMEKVSEIVEIAKEYFREEELIAMVDRIIREGEEQT